MGRSSRGWPSRAAASPTGGEPSAWLDSSTLRVPRPSKQSPPSEPTGPSQVPANPEPATCRDAKAGEIWPARVGERGDLGTGTYL